MDYKIRKALREDMPQVLELIKELAAYENASDQVEITIADLEDEGFEKAVLPVLWRTLKERWKEWHWSISGFQPGKAVLYILKISLSGNRCAEPALEAHCIKQLFNLALTTALGALNG